VNTIALSIQIPEKIHGRAELTTPNSRKITLFLQEMKHADQKVI